MSRVFPASDQSIGDLSSALAELDLVEDSDFWLRFTWDHIAHFELTPEAYEAWMDAQPKAKPAAKKADEPAADKAPEKTPESDDSFADKTQTSTRKPSNRAAKRR